jgi:hypothetical protein
LKEIAVNTALNASIENGPTQESVSLAQQALGTHEWTLQPAYALTRASSIQLNRSRVALLNTQIDDGFRPFRVF